VKIQLCGLPLSVHRRLMEESNDWDMGHEWVHTLRATPINHTSPRPFTLAELGEIAAAVGEGFTHIALAATRDWRRVAEDLKFDCRVAILRPVESNGVLSWPALRDEIWRAVAIEEIWLAQIAPRDVQHQLLLPPPVFTTHKGVHLYWEACDTYKVSGIEAAEKILKNVTSVHRKRRDGQMVWVDAKGRDYKIDRSFHSRSQDDRQGVRRYRFCFQIPPGFHYDVSKNGDTFDMELEGRAVSMTHANVTPWGYVRRG